MGSRGNGTTLQRLCWLVVALAVILWQAPDFIASLYPSRTVTYDFYQDWASARNSLNGDPVYADISLTIERYLGWPMPENWPARYWRMNFHPPPAVLLTLPLAWLEYPDAFLLWSLISLVALVATAWLLVRQLNVRPSTQSWLTIIAVLLAWYPFQQQVMQGQVNLVLLLMLTGIWVAHRSGRYRVAGAVLGAATAVKLFPGLLFLYFVLRRQWTVVVSAVVSLVIVTALSVAVLGSTTYVDYVTDVLPASDQWLSHWYNTSLMALWTKLFNPGPAGGNIVPAWQSAGLARVGRLVVMRGGGGDTGVGHPAREESTGPRSDVRTHSDGDASHFADHLEPESGAPDLPAGAHGQRDDSTPHCLAGRPDRYCPHLVRPSAQGLGRVYTGRMAGWDRSAVADVDRIVVSVLYGSRLFFLAAVLERASAPRIEGNPFRKP